MEITSQLKTNKKKGGGEKEKALLLLTVAAFTQSLYPHKHKDFPQDSLEQFCALQWIYV